MNTLVLENCRRLVENRDILRSVYRFEGNMLLAGSSFYVGKGIGAYAEKIKQCEQILKSNTGILSEFRGNARLAVVCKMAASDDPAGYLEKLKKVLEPLRRIQRYESAYSILSAMTVADRCNPEEYDTTVMRMDTLYRGMKKLHPWLTSDEDLPFAAMLALTGFDSTKLTADSEECYKILLTKFKDRNALQTLSHVLALDPSPAAEKCARVSAIFDMLKRDKHKYGTGWELSVLGTMSVLNLSAETVTAEIIEADEFLKAQKGFGDFSMGADMRRMYAALMVMDAHVPNAADSHDALINSVLAIVIAIELCMICIMASTASH